MRNFTNFYFSTTLALTDERKKMALFFFPISIKNNHAKFRFATLQNHGAEMFSCVKKKKSYDVYCRKMNNFGNKW